MGKSDNLFELGLLFLVYWVLYSQGFITKPKRISTETTAACPRGKTYSRGLFGDCDPNYTASFFGLGGDCNCLSSIEKPTETEAGNTTEQGGASPGQYTAPAKCPYDNSLLSGDKRCTTPTSGEQTLMSGINPFTGFPWLPQGGWI